MFIISGCNITIQGKLLLVLDSINSTLRNYFSCFCEVVQARLNNTNVTIEIMAGGNQTSCSNPDIHSNVDEALLEEKLKDLNLEYEPHDAYVGMAVLLTDRGFTSENFSALSDGKEPFVYFVNVGENESQNSSCYRQYRCIDDMTEINEIGLELESIACNRMYHYPDLYCISAFYHLFNIPDKNDVLSHSKRFQFTTNMIIFFESIFYSFIISTERLLFYYNTTFIAIINFKLLNR